MFRSFPLCLGGMGYRQLRTTLNGNPKGRTTLRIGFPFACGYLPRRKFIWSEDLLFSFLLSFIDRELFCFPPIFSFLLFPIFYRESFFSFSFLSLYFFLFFLFIFFRSLIGNLDFSIHYSLSLNEILLSFFFGERMRILFTGQGSK